MLYNEIFSAQKKSEGIYNEDSDALAEEIMNLYCRYVADLKQQSHLTVPQRHLFNGLVVGYVQSGKTMNYCHLINRAIDKGFQLIVLFSSNKNDLNMQTTDRIAKDIIGYCNPKVHMIRSLRGDKKGFDFESFYKNGIETGIAISSAVNRNIIPDKENPLEYQNIEFNDRTPKVYWLTACDMGTNELRNVDFSINYGNNGTETLDDYMKIDLNGCFVAIVKKNRQRLDLLKKFLENSDVVKKHKIRALFIDDECDEITVSGKGKALGKSSVIIDSIQKLFGTNSNNEEPSMYVEYTATPIANICVKNRSNTNTGFPDDFIRIMKKPDAYCGFEAFERFKEITNVINPIQNEDRIELATVEQGKGIETYKKGSPILYIALLQFIINCAIFERRFNSDDSYTSMLVHTDRLTDEHTMEKEYVENLLNEISVELFEELEKLYTLNNGSYQPGAGLSLMDDISGILRQTQDKMDTCDRKGWYNEPEFQTCAAESYPHDQIPDDLFFSGLLKFVMRNKPGRTYHSSVKYDANSKKKIHVLEINSTSEDIIPIDQNFIAVGGNKLNRGLTLHNLSVTYFTRTTGAIDTYTQMSRWFGFRIGYFDLCRLYIPSDQDLKMAKITEDEIHRQIYFQNSKGIIPKDMHLILDDTQGANGMILSGKQKLKKVSCNANSSFEVLNYYPIRGNRQNKEVIEQFFKQIFQDGKMPEDKGSYGKLEVIAGAKYDSRRHCYVREVSINRIYQLFEEYCSVSNQYEEDILLVLEEYLKKQNTPDVNVLLSGRSANANSGKFSGFNNDIYKVWGLAQKNTADMGKSPYHYYKVRPFDDCAEDYVVDYPSPSNLNEDFARFTGNKIFDDSRSEQYLRSVMDFGRSYREKPLMIITPFEFSSHVQHKVLTGSIYYSIQMLMPKSYSDKTMLVI